MRLYHVSLIDYKLPSQTLPRESGHIIGTIPILTVRTSSDLQRVCHLELRGSLHVEWYCTST